MVIKLLKELNTTILTLIPKFYDPSSVNEFRPIPCNVVYKCITEAMCFRLKLILRNIVAEDQGEFIHKRFIGHNIEMSRVGQNLW